MNPDSLTPAPVDGERYTRITKVFLEASRLHGAERDRFLAQHIDIRADVEAMLVEDAAATQTQPPDTNPFRTFEDDLARSLPFDEIGRYRIEKQLGSGGMGLVYLARRDDSALVALKIPNPLHLSTDALRRLEREALVLQRLRHPGIAECVDLGVASTVVGLLPFIAVRFVDGVTLGSSLPRNQVATLDEIQARVLLVQRVAEALHAAHEAQVIHRDVKPANIMVTVAGEPVVVDFGIALVTVSDMQVLTGSGRTPGSPPYMSPEQVTSQLADRRTDIWSLGVTLFQSLTGQRPFDRPTETQTKEAILRDPLPNIRSLNPLVPRPLATIVGTALEKDRALRYQTANDFASDLGSFLAGKPILAKPPSLRRRLISLAKAYPALTACTVGTSLALVLGLLVVLSLLAQEQRLLLLRNKDTIGQLLQAESLLWPRRPDKAKEMADWLATADDVLARTNELEMGRASCVPGSREYLEFDAILRGLPRLAAARESVADRLHTLQSIESKSRNEAAPLWELCTASLKDDARFSDTLLYPLVGLVPLGKDHVSGLWEFWSVESGDQPPWEGTPLSGHLGTYEEQHGIVFVLVPSGTFWLGTRSLRDSFFEASTFELEGRQETVQAFFVSKFEVTQAQWFRMTGDKPSLYYPGTHNVGHEVTLLHPVEQVTWWESKRVLQQYALRLPTEAEWEYACEAGSETLWPTGDDPASLEGFANVVDKTMIRFNINANSGTLPAATFDDHYNVHAPVGRFRPNAFGLHDMIGNVSEWTETVWDRYHPRDPASQNALNRRTVHRGGNYGCQPWVARTANRDRDSPGAVSGTTGVRPAISLMAKAR